MIFGIGKRVWVGPRKCEATIHKVYHLPEREWDDSMKPIVSNIIVQFDNGDLCECNNWQLKEIAEREK